MKLTPSLVRKIRRSNKTYEKIAKKYGVSKSTVCNIKNRKTWTQVHDLIGDSQPPSFARGRKHCRALLIEQDIKEIRLSPLSNKELAERFAVTPGAIYKIRKRITWRHIY